MTVTEERLDEILERTEAEAQQREQRPIYAREIAGAGPLEIEASAVLAVANQNEWRRVALELVDRIEQAVPVDPASIRAYSFDTLNPFRRAGGVTVKGTILE